MAPIDTSNTRHPPASSLASDIRLLSAIYIAWKSLLLLVVAASPGPGYDTSANILFHHPGAAPDTLLTRSITRLCLRLTRWDAVYFSSTSVRGHVLEQEWAFSWALSRLTAALAHIFPLPLSTPPIAAHVLAGLSISLFSHFGAVVLLYLLVSQLLPSSPPRKRQLALTTALLHILSPAGVFLLAPYGESLFALLTLAGFLAYTHAIHHRYAPAQTHLLHEALYILLAGCCFGLSLTIRSNGILNGLILAWDAAGLALTFCFGTRSRVHILRLAATLLAGTMTAIGFALPQYVAYRQYCQPIPHRPWCSKVPPSIYSWVQFHYWHVGFLHYWTPSNIPLFLLAAPTLLLLAVTAYAALHHARPLLLAVNGEETPARRASPAYLARRATYTHLLERLALPQLALALLAATNFHVQIINRIASGCILSYLVLAVAIHDASPRLACGHARAEHYFPLRWLSGKVPEVLVRGCVVYAVVQAGLFASFLPPA